MKKADKKTVLLVLSVFLSFTLFYSCSNSKEGLDPVAPPVAIEVDADSNLYGLITNERGEPISGVVVSDGSQCVLTNTKGVYQMERDKTAEFVFYSTPAQYEIAVLSERTPTPQFYAKVTAGIAKVRKDFTLKTRDKIDKEFTLICIGDPQCKSAHVKRFEQEAMKDIKATALADSKSVYGLALGDITHDVPEIFGNMRSVLSTGGFPVFSTIGNHDKVATRGADLPRDAKRYEAVFGPLDYSFNIGDVHFVCMDNVIFTNGTDYKGGFTAKQVEWLRQDLEQVSKDKMIVFYCHIPFRTSTSDHSGTVLNLLSPYKEVHLMIGHTHYNENYIHTSKKIYEHIHGAACGAWWYSTMNGDGTPNGYAVYSINGSTIDNWYYKASLHEKGFQIRLHRGNDITGGATAHYVYNKSLYSAVPEDASGYVFANVWNADTNWKIELYEDGVNKGSMSLLTGTIRDAWAMGYHIGVLGRSTSSYSTACKHLYYKKLVNAGAKVKVVATDKWGNQYEQENFVAGQDYLTAVSPTY